jgi:alcohol dehydrogenase (cytochrome c)
VPEHAAAHHGDAIIYGPAGADWGAKNWVGAFNLATGEPVWRFNLIPDANSLAQIPGATRGARARRWQPVDAARSGHEEGVLYLPVGNPHQTSTRCPGANLYTNSAVALDVKTGNASITSSGRPISTIATSSR